MSDPRGLFHGSNARGRGRVVDAQGKTSVAKAEVSESMSQFRLSCTIISKAKATAIIKHLGKSFVVTVGDVVDGRTVSLIDKKRVILKFNGEEIILVNRPAPLGEIKFETKEQLDKIDL